MWKQLVCYWRSVSQITWVTTKKMIYYMNPSHSLNHVIHLNPMMNWKCVVCVWSPVENWQLPYWGSCELCYTIVKWCVDLVNSNHGDGIKPISKLCYQLLVKSDSSYHGSWYVNNIVAIVTVIIDVLYDSIFQLLSLHPIILKYLWTSITNMKSAGIL